MARPRVYIETTIISYLTARPSRDMVTAGHQQVTREWWDRRRSGFDLFVSEVVTREALAGDAKAARTRVATIADLPKLDITDEVALLAPLLIGPGVFPRKAVDDAVHLAVATVHRMDFLLTWNLRHLANAQVARAAYHILRAKGYEPPTICTPDELEGQGHDV